MKNEQILRGFRGQVLKGIMRLLVLQHAFRMLGFWGKDVGLRTS